MRFLAELIHHRGLHAVTALQVAALAPPLVIALGERGFHSFQILVAAAITALVWETAFALLRKQTLGLHGLTTAMIVTVFAPADLPLWQLSVAVTLGVVLGELVFGGRGFGFLSAAAASLALLSISFPGLELAAASEAVAVAALPGAVLLMAAGLLSWKIVLAVPAGLVLASLVAGVALDPFTAFVALAFGLVFLIGDPTAAASTGPGRWAYGLLAGALIVLFGGPVAPAAIVSAAVLASVFTPLIDHLAVLASAGIAGRRHA